MGRLSDMVRKAIEDSGLEVTEIADRSGVSVSQIYRFLKGERTLTLATGDKIMEGLEQEPKVAEEQYHKFIAEAAREYHRAWFRNRLDCTEESARDLSRAFETMAWMIDAQTHGWDPTKYVPEWEERSDGEDEAAIED